MKSYDETYQNVLRRRDEQMAKKRRRIAIAGSAVLPAVMLSAAVGIGAAAWRWGVPAENGGNEISPSSGNADVSAGEMLQQTADVQPPVQLIDNRLIFMENGENIDITHMISEKIPYIYEYTDEGTGLACYAVAGGTPENYGWAKFSMYELDAETPENSKWINYTCNTLFADRQDRKWYEAAITQLSEKPENNRIILWSMTERAWMDQTWPYNTLKILAAQDSLDGYDVYLHLEGVDHIPTEEEAYYTAERIGLTVKYYDGRHHDFSDLYDIDALNDEFRDRLIADDNLKILRLTDGGRIRHVLMLRNYSEEDTCWHTVFITLDNNPGSKAQLYTFGGEENYTVNTGDCRIVNMDGTDVLMTNVDGSVYAIAFDFTELSFTCSPTDQAWDTAGSVVAQDSLGGYTAYLELEGAESGAVEIGNRENPYYSDAVITVIDPDGHRASVSLLNELSGNVQIPHILDNAINGKHPEAAVKLFEMDYNGEKRYVLALRGYGDMTSDEVPVPIDPYYSTVFFAVEPECFDSGKLELYRLDGNMNYGVTITDGFRLDHDIVFVDVEGSVICEVLEFDPDSLTFTFEMTNEPVE